MSELHNGWSATSSGEICEYITSGSRDWKSYYSDQGPLFIRTQDINQDCLNLSEVAHVTLPEKVEGKRSRIQPGDLLVTITGANVGKVALVPADIPEAYVSQSVGLMRLKDKRNASYLHYYLQSDRTGRKQVLDMVYGIGRPVLSLQNLRDIPISLPPLPEQRRIVAEIEKQFTRLDVGVAALRRVQANLKRYRAAVLKAACEGRLVSTEAELAKTENRKSKFETGEALLARILSERRKNWQGRGKYKEPAAPDPTADVKLPEGWVSTGFEQLADGTKNAIKAGPFGSALKKSFYTPNGYKIYGQEQVIKGDPYSGDYFIPIEHFKKLQSCEVKPGDILISLVGTTGKVLILPEDCTQGIINPRLLKLSLNRAGVNSKFIRILLESATTRAFFKLAAHGGTMEILNLGILKTLPIALPPLAEQTRIVAEVERRQSVIEELETAVSVNLQRAIRLRQSILQKAFSGNL